MMIAKLNFKVKMEAIATTEPLICFFKKAIERVLKSLKKMYFSLSDWMILKNNF